jgi:hypothetical protein
MDRREFLKLSSFLTAGFILSKAVGIPLNLDSIVIYKVTDEFGNIKIGATRYNNPSCSYDSVKFDPNSFQILESFDNIHLVSDRKIFWYKKEGIEIINRRLVSFSIGSVKGGKKAGKIAKETGKIKIAASAAGKVSGPRTVSKIREKYILALAHPVRGIEIRKIHSNTLKTLRTDNNFKEKLKIAHSLSKSKKQSELDNIKKATEKMSERIQCPFCDKEGARRIMARWHGDKCKKRTSL